MFDYGLGLTSEERGAPVEASMAPSESAVDIRARIQTALGLLESLHPEPCPQELADSTVRCLCAMAQGAQTPAPTKTTRLRSR
jgi:hypothetical protein